MNVLTPPKTMLEVFKLLPEGTLCQLINNQLIMSPAPSDPHQKTVLKLGAGIFDFVEENNLGEVRIAPYDVYINNKNVYQPDIVFIAKENLHKIKKNGLHGAPDLVVEILSPETAKYDLTEKKKTYERFGVKEYWAVEPETKKVAFYKLVEDKFVEMESERGTIKSGLLQASFSF